MIPETGERGDFKETLLALTMGQCALCLGPFIVEEGMDNIVCFTCLNSGAVLAVVGKGKQKAYVVNIANLPPSMEETTIGEMRHRLRDAQSPLRR